MISSLDLDGPAALFPIQPRKLPSKRSYRILFCLRAGSHAETRKGLLFPPLLLSGRVRSG